MRDQLFAHKMQPGKPVASGLSTVRVCLWLAGFITLLHPSHGEMKPSPGINLAAGKLCEFTKKPDYGYCTDKNDPKDLTDGKYWQSGGDKGFWTQKATVGWSVPKKPVGIKLDLGQIAPIQAVTFDSSAGRAQVTFPAAALLYVSDDGEQWHFVTDLINEAIPQFTFVRHRFKSEDLNTRGRYVFLYLVAGGFYIFTDEIEILKGGHDPAAVNFEGQPIKTAGLIEHVTSRGRFSKQKNTSLYLIRTARETIKKQQDGSKDEALTKLTKIAAKSVNRDKIEKVDYQKGPPFTRIDADTCKTVGEFFSKTERPRCQVWKPAPTRWNNHGPFDRPEGNQDVSLEAHMMVNEYEAVAFNLSNNTSENLAVQLSLLNEKFQKKGEKIPPGSVTIRQAVLIEASGYRLYADALPQISEGKTEIPAGMTKQIWLTIHSKDLEPGNYSSVVTVESDGDVQAVPLSVRVYPAKMPSNPKYLTTLFSYFSWKPVKGREKATSKDLAEHYANTQVLHHGYIPWPKRDKNNNPLQPLQLDTTKLDEMLDYMPHIQLWILWPGLEFGFFRLRTNHQLGTPEHTKMFKEWVRLVRDHLKSKGITTDGWCFMWTDEPGEKRWKEMVVPASRMAKEVDPTILVWEDQQIPMDLLRETDSLCDIYCPPLDKIRENKELHEFILKQKHPGWHYQCASSKESPPHLYYRVHHWQSWDLGLGGAAMWVYTDDLGTWNDYDGGTSYSMIYEGKDGPITSKRWEAWRDGIEDYEMMRLLREKARKDNNQEILSLIKSATTTVLENQTKPEVLPKLRKQLLESFLLKAGAL